MADYMRKSAAASSDKPEWWRPSDAALVLDDLSAPMHDDPTASDDDQAWCNTPNWEKDAQHPARPAKSSSDGSPGGSTRSSSSDRMARPELDSPPAPRRATQTADSRPKSKSRAKPKRIGVPGRDSDEEDVDYFPPQPMGGAPRHHASGPTSPPPLSKAKPAAKTKAPRKSALKNALTGKKGKKDPSASAPVPSSAAANAARRQSADRMRGSSLAYRPSDLDPASALRRDSLAMLADGTHPLANSRFSDMGVELPDFLLAARTGNIATLQQYLQAPDAGREIMQRDAVHGQTALHLAVRCGQFIAVRALCTSQYRACLLTAVDARENTPLHLAAARSRRVTEYLVQQAGADVNAVNARDQTPLGVHILTTRRDDPMVAELLLQHGADPNAALNDSTLLHVAVEQQLIEIAACLVRYGAELDIKDEHGKTIFDKVTRKVLRKLISQIAYPPAWVADEDRTHCMLCSTKFRRLGARRHHCRHCGRVCCTQCAHAFVEAEAFPETFQASTTGKEKSWKHGDKKRVCTTCSSVFRERELAQKEKQSRGNFVQKVLGCEWEEVRQVPSSSNADLRRSSSAGFRGSVSNGVPANNAAAMRRGSTPAFRRSTAA